MPFPLILNDSPVAKLLKCNLMTICAAMRTVLTDTWRRAIPRRQPRLLSYLFTYHQPMVLEYAVYLLSLFCLLDTTDSFTHASATFSSPLSVSFVEPHRNHVYVYTTCIFVSPNARSCSFHSAPTSLFFHSPLALFSSLLVSSFSVFILGPVFSALFSPFLSF